METKMICVNCGQEQDTLHNGLSIDDKGTWGGLGPCGDLHKFRLHQLVEKLDHMYCSVCDTTEHPDCYHGNTHEEWEEVTTRHVNLTPHIIRLNDGRIFKPSGIVCRVSSSYTDFVDDVASICFGEIIDLPGPTMGVRYIVSGLVMSALKGSRQDCVSPATGHPSCVRDVNGQIYSVPGFVR